MPRICSRVGDDHVPERPGLLVEAGSALDVDRLGDVDLHVGDVVAVPDRLEHAVGKPGHEDVLSRFLAEEVVDPVDRPPRPGPRAARRSAPARCPRRGRTASRPRARSSRRCRCRRACGPCPGWLRAEPTDRPGVRRRRRSPPPPPRPRRPGHRRPRRSRRRSSAWRRTPPSARRARAVRASPAPGGSGSRKSSSLPGEWRPEPMIRKSSGIISSRNRWKKPGNSLRAARSPVAPNRTRTRLEGRASVVICHTLPGPEPPHAHQPVASRPWMLSSLRLTAAAAGRRWSACTASPTRGGPGSWSSPSSSATTRCSPPPWPDMPAARP